MAIDAYAYEFNAIRGIQAGREYFAVNCPLGLVPRILTFNNVKEAEIGIERRVHKPAALGIARYLIANRHDYVLSSLVASLDGEWRFEKHPDTPSEPQLGRLTVSMSANLLVNDGQHRREAIETALADCPELRNETIPILFYPDPGLQRARTMFLDLSRRASRLAIS